MASREDKRFKGPFWGLITRFLSNRRTGGLYGGWDSAVARLTFWPRDDLLAARSSDVASQDPPDVARELPPLRLCQILERLRILRLDHKRDLDRILQEPRPTCTWPPASSSRPLPSPF